MVTWPAYLRFRPIERWPGEPTRTRRASPFSANLSTTLDLLGRELRELRAGRVVLQIAVAERDIRQDGYPRADARPGHPGVILSMDSPYGPLSYPCDRFHHWHDNLRAVALALEALRKVDRYGVTKRGEQYTGWKQLSTGTAPPTADEAARFIAEHGDPTLLELGGWGNLRSTAYRSELDRAYRSAARKLHPDAGGSAELFHQLQQARKVLTDG